MEIEDLAARQPKNVIGLWSRLGSQIVFEMLESQLADRVGCQHCLHVENERGGRGHLEGFTSSRLDQPVDLQASPTKFDQLERKL